MIEKPYGDVIQSDLIWLSASFLIKGGEETAEFLWE